MLQRRVLMTCGTLSHSCDVLFYYVAVVSCERFMFLLKRDMSPIYCDYITLVSQLFRTPCRTT